MRTNIFLSRVNTLGHFKRSIPFNLAKRLVSIVANPGTSSYRLEELKEFLLKRKYPDKLIDNGF